jgi:hypothetical protein
MTMTADSCPQCGGVVPITYGDRVACPYCGSSLVHLSSTGAGPSPPGPDSAQDTASAWGVRMKRARLDDARARLPVFEWLIPAGWEFQGNVMWRNSVAMPALIAFKAWNPAGTEQIECLPTIPNTWTRTALTAAFRRFQPKSFGFKLDGLEQRAPLKAQEALRQLVVPRYRGLTAAQRSSRLGNRLLGFLDPELVQQRIHQVPGLPEAIDYIRKLKSHGYASPDVEVQIIKEERLPQLAASLRQASPEAGPPPQGDGARIRLRYTLEGHTLDEDIFCVVSSVTTQTDAGLLAEEQVHWVAESLFAFRAEKGRIDAMTRASMASVRSLRMNPQWFTAYQAESQRILQERIAMQKMLQQMAAQQRASFQRQMHRLSDVSRTLSDTSDMIMAGYEDRSASYDRMSQGWSEAIRGVDSYASPGGGSSVELPGGYQHAWTNGLGEYVLTDSSFLDPNQFASGNWEVMSRTRQSEFVPLIPDPRSLIPDPPSRTARVASGQRGAQTVRPALRAPSARRRS